MKYKAQLDHFDIEVSEISTGIEKSIAEYSVPFADGGILDNMGVKARTFRLRTHWRRSTYDAHEFFVEHARADIVNTLIHPEYGTVRGHIKSVSVTHDIRTRYAEVDVEFIETTDVDAVPAFDPSLESAIETAVMRGQADQMAAVAAAVQAILGPALAASVLSVALDPNQGILGQLNNLTAAGRRYIAQVDTALSVIDAALVTIANPADSVLTMVEYGTALPGRVIGSVARCVERYALAVATVNNSPQLFVQSFRNGIGALAASVGPLRSQILSAAGQIGAVVVARLYAAEEEKRNVLRREERTPLWSAEGKLLSSREPLEILTVGDLERSSALLRADIQAAIDALRVEDGTQELIDDLKRIAERIIDHVSRVKIETDRLITVDIDTMTPLHLVCVQNNLPYTYAERLTAINDIPQPSFCVGEMSIYAR